MTHCHSIQQRRQQRRAGPGTSPGPAKRYVLFVLQVQLTLPSQVKFSFDPSHKLASNNAHLVPSRPVLPRLVNEHEHAFNNTGLVASTSTRCSFCLAPSLPIDHRHKHGQECLSHLSLAQSLTLVSPRFSLPRLSKSVSLSPSCPPTFHVPLATHPSFNHPPPTSHARPTRQMTCVRGCEVVNGWPVGG